MRRFKSPEQAQRFLEAFGSIYDHCCPRRHLLGAVAFRQELVRRHATWREIAGIAVSQQGQIWSARAAEPACEPLHLPSRDNLTMPFSLPLAR